MCLRRPRGFDLKYLRAWMVVRGVVPVLFITWCSWIKHLLFVSQVTGDLSFMSSVLRCFSFSPYVVLQYISGNSLPVMNLLGEWKSHSLSRLYLSTLHWRQGHIRCCLGLCKIIYLCENTWTFLPVWCSSSWDLLCSQLATTHEAAEQQKTQSNAKRVFSDPVTLKSHEFASRAAL